MRGQGERDSLKPPVSATVFQECVMKGQDARVETAL
jgi:hypothetical protein